MTVTILGDPITTVILEHVLTINFFLSYTGAYGTAVLYRKRDDDSLVILKEITITDLSANERLMAKNEVTVIHPPGKITRF